MDEQTPPNEPQSPPPEESGGAESQGAGGAGPSGPGGATPDGPGAPDPQSAGGADPQGAPLPHGAAGPQGGAPPRRLERSSTDRMLGGVAGGVARYLGVDATLVRIVTVGLAFLGGAGVLLYLAALLLMPEEGQPAPKFPGTGGSGDGGRTQALTVLGVIVLIALALGGLAVVGAVLGWILFPIAFLVVAGLFAWWIASGERPAGSPGEILKRAGLGVLLLLVCLLLALGGGWAAAAGSGTVGAALVIGAGVVLVAAAFARPARWLIMPALALALSAAFVMATGITLDGGIGEREYRPTTANDVRDKYELGIGEMVVDLRAAKLPPGDRNIEVDVGIGHAVVLVPKNVCVTTEAEVGVGAVDSFDSENGGIDVEHTDAHSAPAGTPRVILKSDMGVGMLDVHHNVTNDSPGDWNDHHREFNSFDAGGNDACIGGARAHGGGGGGNG
jgi:phage shock protein PspC (stress-responsive transcriptional regulator)